MFENLIAKINKKKAKTRKKKTTKKKAMKTKKRVKRVKKMTKAQLNAHMKKLEKEIHAFANTTDKFLGSIMKYASLHPKSVKKIEKHVLNATHNIEKLRKTVKK